MSNINLTYLRKIEILLEQVKKESDEYKELKSKQEILDSFYNLDYNFPEEACETAKKEYKNAIKYINKKWEDFIKLSKDDKKENKCPKCDNICDENAMFCSKCGYKFVKNKNNTKFWVVLKIFISLIILALFTIAVIYFQFNEKISPYSFGTTLGDTYCEIITKYNKENKTIHVTLSTNEKIEKWQTEYLSNNPEISIIFKNGDSVKKLDSQDTVFIVDSNLQADFYIYDASIEDYVDFKNIVRRQDVSVYTYTALSLDSNKRNNEKKIYEAQKRAEAERQRRIAEEEKRQQDMIDGLNALGTMMLFGGL